MFLKNGCARNADPNHDQIPKAALQTLREIPTPKELSSKWMWAIKWFRNFDAADKSTFERDRIPGLSLLTALGTLTLLTKWFWKRWWTTKWFNRPSNETESRLHARSWVWSSGTTLIKNGLKNGNALHAKQKHRCCLKIGPKTRPSPKFTLGAVLEMSTPLRKCFW